MGHTPSTAVRCKKNHAKKFSIKNSRGPQEPPPRNSSCRAFSCILKGKQGPKHKEFAGSGVPRGGGLGGGVSAQILYVYALFWFLRLGLSRRDSENFRKDPGNALRAFPGIPLESTAGIAPKPFRLRHLRLPEHFQNSLPLSTAGDASFFRSGSGQGLSELVMEFPAVLGVFLKLTPKELSGVTEVKFITPINSLRIFCCIRLCKFPNRDKTGWCDFPGNYAY